VLRDSVIGEYERKDKAGYTIKHVFLENGLREIHFNRNIVGDNRWTIIDREIHIRYKLASGFGFESGTVFRINPDKSITYIAIIRGGKRTDSLGVTYYKIK
jgi:hypothetical protein